MNGAPIEFDQPGTYRIKVHGYLDSSWSDRLGGMAITSKTKGDAPPVTTLSGELVDEAALAGVLSALYDLGYSLQSVKKDKAKEVQRVQKES
jgi:hypothetical protein